MPLRNEMKKWCLENWSYSQRTNEKCPYCSKGRILIRDYVTVHSNPGTLIQFAMCDNEECNVEWLASDTEKIRREKTCPDEMK